MRGSPILRAVLVVAALLLLLPPLIHLTRPVSASPAGAPVAQPVKTSVVHLALASTRVPLTFEVRYLGHVIWSGEMTGSEERKDVAMEFPKEGVDLELKGSWTGTESMAAVKLSVAPGEGLPVEKSVWATKQFDEVLTFQQ